MTTSGSTRPAETDRQRRTDAAGRVATRPRAAKILGDLRILNHACFNGLTRFNRRGKFSAPFGHQPGKFSATFVSQLRDRLVVFAASAQAREWSFVCQDWKATLSRWRPDDFVYSDPPYVGRHTAYYTGWSESDSAALAQTLRGLPMPWALSDWAEAGEAGSPRLAALYPSPAHF